MIIVTSAPTVVPGAELFVEGVVGVAPRRQRLQLLWTGTDGTVWDLTAGPVYAGAGVSGLGFPVPDHVRRTSIGADGATWGGYTDEVREIGLPLTIVGTEEWASILDIEAAFFAGLDPGRTGVLTVVRPDGAQRSIACRYDSGAEGAWEVDPVFSGNSAYDITLTAEQPYFLGETVYKSYSAAPPPNFFPGPPLHIASAETLDADQVTNTGDLPAPPVWTIRGPFTGFTVGVGPAQVSMVLTKPAGGWVLVDMTEGAGQIVDEAGVNRLGSVTDIAFRSIPAGRDVQLVTAVTGAGVGTSVDLRFTPRYRRAW